MRKLIKVNNQIVTAPFITKAPFLNKEMREELEEKGFLQLALEAAGLIGVIALAWGSLFLINAYYGGL